MDDKAHGLRDGLREALDRHWNREWARRGEMPLSFDGAAQEVASVFAGQADAFLPWNPSGGGVGSRFTEGLAEFGRHFSACPPNPADVEAVIALSATDYYAFVALDFLSKFTPQGIYPALDRWSHDCYLEIRVQPARPKGASRNRFLSRDTLVVGQIKRLDGLGFAPTRNYNKKPGAGQVSACDVVVEAIHLCKRHSSGSSIPILTYDAVEKIWERRERREIPGTSALLLAMMERLSEK